LALTFCRLTRQRRILRVPRWLHRLLLLVEGQGAGRSRWEITQTRTIAVRSRVSENSPPAQDLRSREIAEDEGPEFGSPLVQLEVHWHEARASSVTCARASTSRWPASSVSKDSSSIATRRMRRSSLAAPVANARVHATTGEVPLVRLEQEREPLQPIPTPLPCSCVRNGRLRCRLAQHPLERGRNCLSS
jgi:hypothetical protein